MASTYLPNFVPIRKQLESAWVDFFSTCPTDYRKLCQPDWGDNEYNRVERAVLNQISDATTICSSSDGFNKRGIQLSETDPNGLELKTPGAKADAGKSPVVRGALHYFPRAISACAELSSIGAKKYSWKGWASVSDGINRYGDAMGRHELRIEDDFSRRDPDTGVLEATAVAWNALARLELILREQKRG